MFFSPNNPFNEVVNIPDSLHPDLVSSLLNFDDVENTSNRNRSNTLNSYTSLNSDVSLIDEHIRFHSSFNPLTPKSNNTSQFNTNSPHSHISIEPSLHVPIQSNSLPFQSGSTPSTKNLNSISSPVNIPGNSSSDCDTNDSDDSSILHNSRASTPPTPVSQSLLELNKFKLPSETYFYSQYDYLHLIEPLAAPPPTYSSLPPGGCPKFAIIDQQCGNETLPTYAPSIYKIGAASRKVEWLSPYECSPQRSWKSVIIELNSTQLNVYAVPSNLEQPINNFNDDRDLSEFELKDLKNISSKSTTNYDLQFYNYCQRLELLGDKKLVRSYSLQHARIGLASDYKKKPYVLRLRIESEQILLSFNNIQDLINWNMGLNIGKDIALDLNEREIPRYRTVPRRRRNANATNTTSGRSFSESNLQLNFGASSNRARSNSDPSRIKGTLFKFKNKFSSKSQLNPNADARTPQANAQQEREDEETYHSSNDDYQEDLELADLREDEDDYEIGTGIEQEEGNSGLLTSYPVFTAPTATYSKWDPYIEVPSEYKYYKNCLRCIKPLTMEDSWVSRSLVKPTTLSPLNFAYLLKIKYCPPSINSSASSKSNSFTSLSSLNGNRGRAHSNAFKDAVGFNLPDSVLTKIPDHFLKEYFVGTHGLIPKDVGNLIDQ